MTHQTQATALDQITELLAEHGFDGLAQAVTVPLNEVMKLERAHALGAGPLSAIRGSHGTCQRLQAPDHPHPVGGG